MVKISLKKKNLSKGKSSFYIEFYDGSYEDENGKQKHLRRFNYLGLYLLPETSKENIELNKVASDKAHNIYLKIKSENQPISSLRDLKEENKKLKILISESGLGKELNDLQQKYDVLLKEHINLEMLFNDISKIIKKSK